MLPPGLLHPANIYRRLLPADMARAAASVPPRPAPQVYPPEYHGGPVPGPWQRKGPGPGVISLKPAPPAVPAIPREVYPPPYHGGPVPGPWQRTAGPVPSSFQPAPPGPPGPSPNPPKQGNGDALVPRVVGRDIDERLRRHTDRVADIVNALLNRSNIVYLGAKDYAITTAHLDGRPPTATDDLAAGYVRGSLWVNATDGTVWVNLDNAAGSADWRNITTGLPVGPTGTFTENF